MYLKKTKESSKRSRKRFALGSNSAPINLSQVVHNALQNLGLEDDIARYQFVMHWDKIVGKEIAQRCKPECIRNKALVVRVSTSPWAQELSFAKERILERLKQFVPKEEEIEDLRFYVSGVEGES